MTHGQILEEANDLAIETANLVHEDILKTIVRTKCRGLKY